MYSITRTLTLAGLVLAALAFGASAQNYNLSWNTIDDGGATFSTGRAYSLGGTIGQSDAGVMSGGTFTLAGGFWAGADVCVCPGDTNGDGIVDGQDVQIFVNCLIGGQGCSCADVDGINGVNASDAAAFVVRLLSNTPCS